MAALIHHHPCSWAPQLTWLPPTFLLALPVWSKFAGRRVGARGTARVGRPRA
jgi:hypothetical protein